MIDKLITISHAPGKCERCETEIGSPTPPHLTEAFEETGEILCEDSWVMFLEQDEETP